MPLEMSYCGVKMVGMYHNTITYSPDNRVAKQKTDGTTMLQSIRSAKEKAGSDDTANTVDESMYEKGKKSAG
jgi:hypothetical protein